MCRSVTRLVLALMVMVCIFLTQDLPSLAQQPEQKPDGPVRKEDQPDAFKISKEEQAIVDLTNKERAKTNLPPLKPSEKLFKAARAHSTNMAKQNKASHDLDGKGVTERANDVEYEWANIGENIAWGQRTAESVVQTWMRSEGHRGNILNPKYTEIGVGVAKNAQAVPYYTQVFGAPRPPRR